MWEGWGGGVWEGECEKGSVGMVWVGGFWARCSGVEGCIVLGFMSNIFWEAFWRRFFGGGSLEKG